MKPLSLFLAIGTATLFFTGCQSTPSATHTTAKASHEAPTRENPLLAEYSGPYGGVPAFDKMQLDDLMPALDIALSRYRSETWG